MCFKCNFTCECALHCRRFSLYSCSLAPNYVINPLTQLTILLQCKCRLLLDLSTFGNASASYEHARRSTMEVNERVLEAAFLLSLSLSTGYVSVANMKSFPKHCNALEFGKKSGWDGVTRFGKTAFDETSAYSSKMMPDETTLDETSGARMWHITCV